MSATGRMIFFIEPTMFLNWLTDCSASNLSLAAYKSGLAQPRLTVFHDMHPCGSGSGSSGPRIGAGGSLQTCVVISTLFGGRDTLQEREYASRYISNNWLKT